MAEPGAAVERMVGVWVRGDNDDLDSVWTDLLWADWTEKGWQAAGPGAPSELIRRILW